VAEVFPNANVYRPVFPKANYAPWVEDEGFQKIYSAVRGHTLVDIYRLWELWCLVGETQHLPGNLLEIGVWRGGSAAVMAARLMREDGPSLYLCDTFYGVVKAGPLDIYYRGGEHADTSPQVVMQLLENNLPDARVKILNGVFPEETGAQVVDQIFRLVHVDVDVYQSAEDNAVDVSMNVFPVASTVGSTTEKSNGRSRAGRAEFGISGEYLQYIFGHALHICMAIPVIAWQAK
jgi:O-methyltransferase